MKYYILVVGLCTFVHACLQAADTGVIQIASEQQFSELIERARSEGLTVLADFYAVWCSPCMAMNPILEDFCRQHKKRCIVAKINIDTLPALKKRFNVSRIPAFVVFKNGTAVKNFTGSCSKERLCAVVLE